MRLIIEDDEGRETAIPIDHDEIELSIGRQEDNAVHLPERNVSRHHARLVRHEGQFRIEDLASSYGVFVNGDRIYGSAPLQPGDVIGIGDFHLILIDETAPQPTRSGEDGGDDRLVPPPGSDRDASPHDNLATPQMQPAARPPAGSAISVPSATSDVLLTPDPMPAVTARTVELLPPGQAPRLVLAAASAPASSPSSSSSPAGADTCPREFLCGRTKLHVGRSPDNDLCLEDPSIAPRHARLVRTESGEWRVYNLQSGDGVKVNGEPHAECALHPGDELELGALHYRFVAAGEEIPLASVDATAPAARRGSPLLTVAVVVGVVAAAAAGYLFIHPHGQPHKAPPAATRPASGAAGGATGSSGAPAAAPGTSAPAGAQAQAQQQQATPEPLDARAALQKALEALAEGRALATGPDPKCTEAIPRLQQVLDYAPALAEAHLHLGRCFARQNEMRTAALHFEDFVHERPKDPQSPEVRQWLRTYFKGAGAQPRWSLEEP